MNEFALIAELFAPLAKAPGAFALTDDAALVRPPRGHELVVTTDALIAGVHFFATDPADLIARKALRVNLSDLAAKGAEPLGYLMALVLPRNIRYDWLKAFARGLARDQKKFGLSLLGGDTTATPGPLTIAITALGSVPKGKMIRRKGARPGDRVYVSGRIGDAGEGLAALRRKESSKFIRRYHLPEPRLALGLKLRGVASAALDVSDGLLADLGHIAEVSKVRIVVEAGRIPVSRGVDPVRAATAGDDYEIAFTAHRPVLLPGVTQIGRVEAGEGVVLLDEAGRPIRVPRRGYTHF